MLFTGLECDVRCSGKQQGASSGLQATTLALKYDVALDSRACASAWFNYSQSSCATCIWFLVSLVGLVKSRRSTERAQLCINSN